ncbi:hypothetical protein D3C72_1198280 [compost metagenome]
MVVVQVAVAAGPDEVAHFQPGLLRHHVGQQRIAGDIERHAQEDIGAALVELARQPAIGHVELEERVAGRQLHARDVGHVPGRHDQAARIRIGADLRHQVGDLVDMSAVRRRPRAPLRAVDRAQFAVLVGPFVPDADAVLLQPAHIGRALQEPQQFQDDGLQVQLLGGHHRKAFAQVEAHLVAEHRARAGAGAVGLVGARLVHMAHEVEVLFHRRGAGDVTRALDPQSRHFKAGRAAPPGGPSCSRGGCPGRGGKP